VNIADMHHIFEDIDTNLESIISSIDLRPFQAILRKYNEKLDSFEELMQYLNCPSLSVYKFPEVQQNHFVEIVQGLTHKL